MSTIKKYLNEVKENLQIFISKIAKYRSHYSTEEDTSSISTLAPRVTKQALYEEFLKDKNYKVGKD